MNQTKKAKPRKRDTSAAHRSCYLFPLLWVEKWLLAMQVCFSYELCKVLRRLAYKQKSNNIPAFQYACVWLSWCWQAHQRIQLPNCNKEKWRTIRIMCSWQTHSSKDVQWLHQPKYYREGEADKLLQTQDKLTDRKVAFVPRHQRCLIPPSVLPLPSLPLSASLPLSYSNTQPNSLIQDQTTKLCDEAGRPYSWMSLCCVGSRDKKRCREIRMASSVHSPPATSAKHKHTQQKI